MSCKHLHSQSVKIPVLGGSIDHSEHYCLLKNQSEEKQLEVYQKLFESGLEGSFVTNKCPVAESKNFAKCPFYKQLGK